MLHLNLVSQELRKEIRLHNTYKMLKKANYILIIISISLAMIILVAKIILQNNFNRIVAETTLITKNSQGFNDKAKEINSKIKNIENIQNDFIAWSNLIEDIAQIAADKIIFNSIKISKQSATLELKGFAADREDLVNFKNLLETRSYIKNLDFPVKNILEKNDINFEMKANIDLAQIKKILTAN